MKEFFAQSDREEELSYSLWVDKETFIVSVEQKNFISFLALPLFERLTFLFPELAQAEKQMKSNLKEWIKRYESWGKVNIPLTDTVWKVDQRESDDKESLTDVLSTTGVPTLE